MGSLSFDGDYFSCTVMAYSLKLSWTITTIENYLQIIALNSNGLFSQTLLNYNQNWELLINHCSLIRHLYFFCFKNIPIQLILWIWLIFNGFWSVIDFFLTELGCMWYLCVLEVLLFDGFLRCLWSLLIMWFWELEEMLK